MRCGGSLSNSASIFGSNHIGGIVMYMNRLLTMSLCTLISLLYSSSIAFADWDKTYGTPSQELASSVDQTTDGGYIIAGFTHAYGAGGTVSLIKTDSNGNEMWERTFGGEEWDYIFVVHQTTDGGYIMAGTTMSFGAGDGDLWLIKTDSSGNEVWSRTFGGANNDRGFDVKQTTDGGYILVGDTSSFGVVSYDLWLIKTDSFGHKTWEKFFAGTNWDFGRSVWQTTDGGYIIAGDTSYHGPDEYNIWLIKTDSAGNMMWNKTLGGPLGDQAHDVQQTADGGYIVGGTTYSFGSGDNDFWLIKTNSAGTMMWDKTFGGTAWDELRSVRQTADGGYIMAGTTESYGAGETDVWVIKTDATGNSTWGMAAISSPGGPDLMERDPMTSGSSKSTACA
jgi:hypothetical protein